MRWRNKILVILSVALLFLALAIAFGVYAVKTDLLWRVRDHLARSELELKEISHDTDTVFLDELGSDPRFVLDQSLMLINAEHMLDDDFEAELTEYKTSGVMMNKAIVSSYAELSAAISEKFSQKLYVSSGVRSREEQETLYDDDPTTAQLPGASEHETGLCLDVYVPYYAGAGFLDSEAGKFVNSHCHEYGFIIRYPSYGTEETGIKFEPWHIRYVGEIHARIIYNNKLTLESYISSLEVGKLYECDGYIVTRQAAENGELAVPSGCTDYVISPDNTGYYIVTARRDG